jgi:antitoxin CcdA
MKFKEVRPQPFVSAICCDRCGRRAEEGEFEFCEFTSIEYRAGYVSVFGDQNEVEIDLCQHCLKEVLGQWLRVTAPGESEMRLARALERFDSLKHGGEFPTVVDKAGEGTTAPPPKDAGALPRPPEGFDSWLSYAVATMDVRSAQQEYLFSGEEPPSREAMREALELEIAAMVAVATKLVAK